MQRPLCVLASGLVALALLCGTPARPQGAAAPAEGPVYNIEMLVFRAHSVGAAEDWSAAPALHGTTGDDAPSSARSGRIVQPLPAAQYQLSELEAKLRSTGAYQPLAHIAWSQTPSSFASRAGFSLQQLGLNVPGLAGTVYFERGQYLHLGFALDYTPGAGTTAYHLTEIRRIRFYEKNYYDHPAFGVIALVTPAHGARPAGR
jgi:hypothetical protein